MSEKDGFWWLEHVLACHRTGSRVICDPPVTDTDDDYIVLLDPEMIDFFEKKLRKDGYSIGGSGTVRELKPYPDSFDYWEMYSEEKFFHSWKKDAQNIIITASVDYYRNFVKATLLAKALNLTEKDYRIYLFECITRDVWPTADKDLILKETKKEMIE